MLYVKVGPQKTVEEFPVSERILRARLSDVSLPEELTDAVLAPFGYATVPMRYLPDAPAGHRVILDHPTYEGGRWHRQFQIVPQE